MEYTLLDTYCQKLLDNSSNLTFANASTRFNSEVITLSNVSSGPRQDVFAAFQDVVERYLVTIVSVVGIAFHVGLLCVLKYVWTGGRLLYGLLAVEICRLLGIISFCQFRHHNVPASLEVSSWISLIISACHMLSTWLLYTMATQCFSALKDLQRSPYERTEKRRSLVPRLLGLSIIAIVAHLPFVPYLRVLFHTYVDTGFDACQLPFVRTWDLFMSQQTEVESNLYTQLYVFLLLSQVFLYGLPMFMIGCRDKDVLDLIHRLQGDLQDTHSGRRFMTLHSAMLLTTFCNCYLVLHIPKFLMLLLTFIDFNGIFVKDSYVAFKYTNVMANVAVVACSLTYLPLFIKFSYPMQKLLYKACLTPCYVAIQRLRYRGRSTVSTVEI